MVILLQHGRYCYHCMCHLLAMQLFWDWKVQEEKGQQRESALVIPDIKCSYNSTSQWYRWLLQLLVSLHWAIIMQHLNRMWPGGDIIYVTGSKKNNSCQYYTVSNLSIQHTLLSNLYVIGASKLVSCVPIYIGDWMLDSIRSCSEEVELLMEQN